MKSPRRNGNRSGSSRGKAPRSTSRQASEGPVNARKPWSDREVERLKELALQNTPTRVMGLKLLRSPGSIYSKAAAIGLSLKPSNQRPYG
ncbi:MAG TPA: hypothetical protein VFF65_12630 [Phycisphaerales bacterium]|nr:hypothetical protein [Phycisphaerales bacterium]